MKILNKMDVVEFVEIGRWFSVGGLGWTVFPYQVKVIETPIN